MRILELTDRVVERLLSPRNSGDREANRVATRIVRDVRRHGDRALFAWSRRLDGVKLNGPALWISRDELNAARRQVSRQFLRAVEHAARNIRRVAERQKPRSWRIQVEPGVRVGQRVEPLATIGCYVPGGRYSLVSTLLMTAIPARVAGVGRVIIACPRPSAALLAAASLLGETELARVGGAQTIAAMAYGTESFPRVDKIFGPGNRYVAAAKKLVGGHCATDLVAGPTEVLILATRGNGRFLAADLLAQAEHDADAVAICVTTSKRLALAVQSEIARQLRLLPRTNPSQISLKRNGAILVAQSLNAAVDFANRFASEHLALVGSERRLLPRLRTAGSFFLGPWSAQPVGDYASGANHVLPTGGWARARGGLTTWDFVKCASTQQITREGLRRLAPVVAALADAENLLAHRRAVEVRR